MNFSGKLRIWVDRLVFSGGQYQKLMLIAGVSLLWLLFFPAISFRYDMERFFSASDPEVALYEHFKSVFENENDAVLIGLSNCSGVFDSTFLTNVDSLRKTLLSITEVQRILCPTNMRDYLLAPVVGMIGLPVLDIGKPEKYAEAERRIFKSYPTPTVRGFFSDDKRSLMMLVRFSPGLDKKAGARLAEQIGNLVGSFPFDEYHIAGRIMTQRHYIGAMSREMWMFAGMALVLFTASLYLIFRSAAYTIISLTGILISEIWLFGIIGALRLPMDLMMILLPALILILGTSISIHLLTEFNRLYAAGTSKTEAIRLALKQTGIPNFLNAFTTALGFVSLVFIPVEPLQRFGLLAALGIMISFVVSIFIIPIILQVSDLLPVESKNTFPGRAEPVSLLVRNGTRFPRRVITAFLLAMLAGLIWSNRVVVDSHFLDDLNRRSNLGEDLHFFEGNFSGIKPLEVMVRATGPGNSLLSLQGLRELDSIEQHVRRAYHTQFTFSPLTIIKTINKSLHGGSAAFYSLPEDATGLEEILRVAKKQNAWEKAIPVLSPDGSTARISLRTQDTGSREQTRRDAILSASLKGKLIATEYNITGVAHLLDNTNKHITGHLAKGILLAVLTATLVIWIFAGSLKIALISLVVNLLPLLFAAGILGYSGIPLKVSTALIFTIVFGIALDDSIHFLNHYLRMKRGGSDTGHALQATVAKMANPLFYTSVVLFCGFLVFSFSEFGSIRTMGLLIGASLMTGLVADLMLLPVLLHYFDRSAVVALFPAVQKVAVAFSPGLARAKSPAPMADADPEKTDRSIL